MAVKAKAEITLIRVNDGQNGVGIKSAVVTYQAGASQTTAPTGSWTTSIPKLSTTTPYLWTKTVVTYTDGKTSTSYSISSTLDGVEVGGRNYALESHKLYASNDWSDWFTPRKQNNSCGLHGGMFYFPDDTKIGDTFTVSFDLEWTKFTELSGQEFWANIQWYANGSFNYDFGSPFDLFPIGWKYNEFLSAPGTRRYSLKATLKNQKQIDAGWNMNFRFDYSDGTGKVRIRRMKIERGNKATDWTPAPEDMLSSADGITSTQEQFYLSTSPTTLSGGQWQTSQPSWTQGKFIWRRTLVTYGNGRTEYTPGVNGVCITGNTGAAGTPGKPGTNGANGKMLYGVCSTPATMAAKVATVEGFSLYSGVTVSIKFTYKNAEASPTLDINNTGAKPINTNGTPYAYWLDGASVNFVYDGSKWNVCSIPVYANTTTVGNPSGKNVYIDGDGVDIRDGSAVLSSFGPDTIELGKNSNTTKINMANGMFQVSYSQDAKLTTITSPNTIAISRSTSGTGSQQWQRLHAGLNVMANETLRKSATMIIATSYNNVGETHSSIEINADGNRGEIAMYAEEVKINNETLGDFIVAQGISGGWRYRKWSSGIAECWKVVTIDSGDFALWNEYSYVYCASNKIPGQVYPFPFIEPPCVEVSARAVSYAMNSYVAAQAPESDINKRKAQSQDIWVICPTTSNRGNVEGSIYAHGRYK